MTGAAGNLAVLVGQGGIGSVCRPSPRAAVGWPESDHFWQSDLHPASERFIGASSLEWPGMSSGKLSEVLRNQTEGHEDSGVLPNQVSAGMGDAFLREYAPRGKELFTRQFGYPDSFDAATGCRGVVEQVYGDSH